MQQSMRPFGDHDAPPVARYLGVEGQSFVFDRASTPQPLLKFDDSPEVWALEPFPAPRGDVVYRTDTGEAVLRVTRLGGMTLFTSQEPEGLPAAVLGEADDLGLPPMIPPGVLLQRMIQSTVRVQRAIQHLVTFSAPSVTRGAEPLFADAAAVAADALVRLARRPEARDFLAKLDRVVFLQGAKPDISIMGPVMQITIAPARGFAGRPSSDRLVHAALHHH